MPIGHPVRNKQTGQRVNAQNPAQHNIFIGHRKPVVQFLLLFNALEIRFLQKIAAGGNPIVKSGPPVHRVKHRDRRIRQVGNFIMAGILIQGLHPVGPRLKGSRVVHLLAKRGNESVHS